VDSRRNPFIVTRIQTIQSFLACNFPTLGTLLLDDSEVAVGIVERIGLLLGSSLPALLSNFTPAASSLALGRVGRIAWFFKLALIGHLATTDEFLGKMTAIDVVGSGVYRFDNEILFHREVEEGFDELIGYEPLVHTTSSYFETSLTIDAFLLQITTKFSKHPLLELFLCIYLRSSLAT
jgi:hypothetical protein